MILSLKCLCRLCTSFIHVIQRQNVTVRDCMKINFLLIICLFQYPLYELPMVRVDLLTKLLLSKKGLNYKALLVNSMTTVCVLND